MAKILHTKAVVLNKSVQEAKGIVDAVVGSSAVLDRMGDSINQSGWELKTYKKTNPVILWGHNQKEERPPIGKALKTWVTEKGEKTSKLMFKVQFDLQDKFASEIFRKVKDGFINTVSVGFRPLEWELLDEDNPFSGRKYIKQELLELSFVPVPANPEAVIALKGMKDKRFDPVELKELYPEVKKKKVVKKKAKKVVKKVVKKEVKKVDKKEKTVKKVVKKTIKKKVKKVVKKELKKVVKKLKKIISKRVLPYKDLDTLPESTPWDGPGEIKKAWFKDLKLMCTWHDNEKSDKKSSYKLPHHMAEGHKAVWRGVATSMASLLGASGGVDIPEADRRGIYNHLKKHYKAFGKDVPNFKFIEEQVLASFDEEIHALIFDREDKHAIRLIKKVLKEQKETKKIKKEKKVGGYTQEVQVALLKRIDLTLSHLLKDSEKGGEN